MQQWVEDWVHNCELNHKDPSEVEFVIKDSTERKEYRPFSGYLAWGSDGTKAGIEFFRSDVITFDPKDERPPVGEYWKSRGAPCRPTSSTSRKRICRSKSPKSFHFS